MFNHRRHSMITAKDRLRASTESTSGLCTAY